ncbi:putative ABC transporter permease [Microlunatus ginsengisoli]|uniref:ABC transporter permease n=1 Tax=Microlunatus ginsengisoli TaxID=363863 RepID=A0ABP7A202_9ACTN
MFSASVLGVPLYDVLWGFYVFCVLGVIVEMVFCLAKEGVLESRVGLLYLPLSPIYGFGGVAIGLFLYRYLDQPVIMFFVGILVGTVLEYVASLVMEKAFHTVFWDYSDKPLNLHGRVCAQYSIYWGFLSLLLLYVIVPPTARLIDAIDPAVGAPLLVVLLVLTLLSTVLTLGSFGRLERRIERIRAGDPADSPNSWDRLLERLAPDHVVIDTFPRMSLVLEYLQLTGEQRRWIRVDAHWGRPSELHRQHRQLVSVYEGDAP